MRYLTFTLIVALFSLLSLGCSGGNGNAIEASGTIEGTDVDIGTEVSGKITDVRVDEGSHVVHGRYRVSDPAAPGGGQSRFL